MAIRGLKWVGWERSKQVIAPSQTPQEAQTECMPISRQFLKSKVLHGTVATSKGFMDHNIMSTGLLLHGFHIIVAMHRSSN